MEESLFERNIECFAITQPTIAYRLPYHRPDDVIPCQTSCGEPNLEIKGDGGHYFLHSPAGALAETKQWFAALALENVEVLYLIGAGMGYGYEAAKEWLKQDPKRHLVLLEDSLSVLYYLLQTPVGAALLSDSQVSLRYSQNLASDQALSDWLCWDFIAKPFAVAALPSIWRHRQELVVELNNKLMYDHHRFNEVVDEYLDHGVSYFRNFYRNLLQLPRSYFGNGLFGCFKQVPAIICGAGPSLGKVLPLLQEMNGRALVFAGGSAINALNAAGLQPHFGVGVDPNSYQYQRYVTQSAYEVPFFYRLRLNDQALRLLHGPCLYLTGGGGYDLAKWFEDALGIEGEDLDEGHNVVNFCTSIAHAMGCNPILYVGLDLAYTGMKAYASGIVHQDAVEEKQIVQDGTIDRAAVIREDIYGQPIYTLWKWIAEAEWLSHFAKDHTTTIFLNATQGGLGIEGVENISLEAAASEFLQDQRDLDGMVWAALQRSELPLDSQERIQTAWDELEASLNRCVDSLSRMLKELQHLWSTITATSAEVADIKTGMMAVAELELEAEPAYHHVLSIFNEMYIRTLNRELRQLKIGQDPIWQRQLKLLELETRRYAFLLETAKVHKEVMKEALEEAMR